MGRRALPLQRNDGLRRKRRDHSRLADDCKIKNPFPEIFPLAGGVGVTSLPPFSQRSAAIEDALHRAGIHANLAADVAVCGTIGPH